MEGRVTCLLEVDVHVWWLGFQRLSLPGELLHCPCLLQWFLGLGFSAGR